MSHSSPSVELIKRHHNRFSLRFGKPITGKKTLIDAGGATGFPDIPRGFHVDPVAAHLHNYLRQQHESPVEYLVTEHNIDVRLRTSPHNEVYDYQLGLIKSFLEAQGFAVKLTPPEKPKKSAS